MRQLTTGPSAQPARCSAQTDKRVILPSYSNRNPRQTSLRCFSSTFPFKLPHSTKVASSRPVVDTLRPLQSSAQHSIGDGYPLGNPTPSLIPGLMPTPYAASHSPRSRLQPVACSAGTDVAISEATDNVLRVYYLRRDKQYKGWGLHIWGDVQQETAWTRAMEPTGFTGDAVYFDVPLSSAKGTVGLLVHRGDEKAAGGMVYRVSSKAERWLFDSEVSLLDEAPDLNNLPVGNLLKSYCHWVDTRSLVWRVAPFNEQGNPKVFQLHFKKDAGLKLAGEGIQGADLVIPLEFSSSQLEPKTVSKFPHLQGCVTLKLPEQYVDQIPELVKGQLAVSMLGQDGTILDNTGVQIPGLLDDLFYYHGPLGDVIDADQGHVIRVWAPTAQNVELLHWKELRGGEPSVHPMTASGQGVWSFQRPAEWTGQCYKYRITAFCPWNTQVEMMETTDPYARCTTANGERTLMVDLHNPDLLPAGWNQHTSPPLTNWTDVSVYELHIRDFSSNDPTVPAPLQGRYLAFSPEHVTAQGGDLSNGLKHLQRLRAAGMNHIHLLPTYDYGSVPERPEEQMVVEEDLSKYPPNSEVPQTVIASICDNDAFNWGYDPVHYGVPEGSYSTNPDGSERVLEFRQMVKGLHDMGFRVVLDVVYNHTFRSGPSDALSVLDKVVPGYYHRRGEDGSLMNSTCCNNTASEHLMCEKFIVDDAVHWAKTYKVDGFRFDIMGHILMRTMDKIRAALDQLTLERDGVDGKSMYMYGEAWDFGEMSFNQRGRNAVQLNLAGSKLGAFNDRFRDGCMGGGPFGPPDLQGFVTGLATQPNRNTDQGGPQEQLTGLLVKTDWIKIGLAGNLREYPITLYDGRTMKSGQASYWGTTPVAYGGHPCEHVPYNSCHDNETLFDQVVMKSAPEVDAAGRSRMCLLAQSLVMFSQGVPFIHAGDELLRSKSLDRDSYNSGDWFNKIDWSMQDNNFGVGLPPASKNYDTWEFKGALLGDPTIKPSPEIIQANCDVFLALLRIRYSSPLFRLSQKESVLQQVKFYDAGPVQVPGLIVMGLESPAEAKSEFDVVDPAYKSIVVVFNAAPDARAVPYPAAVGKLSLHPEVLSFQGSYWQGCSCDDGARTLQVGPRTTAVFVETK